MCKWVHFGGIGGGGGGGGIVFSISWGLLSLLVVLPTLIASSCGPQGWAAPGGSWLARSLLPYGSSQGGRSP